jgi:ATP synthase protein I
MALRIGKRAGETLRGAGALSSAGLAFVFALVIGAWLGRILDRWLHTSPLFFILFFFFGLAAGILNVYRAVASATDSDTGPAPGEKGPGSTSEPSDPVEK